MDKQDSAQIIAGVDEAGRGPLAGPVVAAAVILRSNIDGLTDSKLLTEKKRIKYAQIIKNLAIDYSIGYAYPKEIDEINIHNATLLAMKIAIEQLRIKPTHVLIDGLFIPKGIDMTAEAIVKGDQKVQSISAASIIAKTTRDELMIKEDLKYPQYGFAKHKGYPTRIHVEAIQKYGITPIHRKTFQPIKSILKEQ